MDGKKAQEEPDVTSFGGGVTHFNTTTTQENVQSYPQGGTCVAIRDSSQINNQYSN